jgi:hypothetical protein
MDEYVRNLPVILLVHRYDTVAPTNRYSAKQNRWKSIYISGAIHVLRKDESRLRVEDKPHYELEGVEIIRYLFHCAGH